MHMPNVTLYHLTPDVSNDDSHTIHIAMKTDSHFYPIANDARIPYPIQSADADAAATTVVISPPHHDGDDNTADINVHITADTMTFERDDQTATYIVDEMHSTNLTKLPNMYAFGRGKPYDTVQSTVLGCIKTCADDTKCDTVYIYTAQERDSAMCVLNENTHHHPHRLVVWGNDQRVQFDKTNGQTLLFNYTPTNKPKDMEKWTFNRTVERIFSPTRSSEHVPVEPEPPRQMTAVLTFDADERKYYFAPDLATTPHLVTPVADARAHCFATTNAVREELNGIKWALGMGRTLPSSYDKYCIDTRRGVYSTSSHGGAVTRSESFPITDPVVLHRPMHHTNPGVQTPFYPHQYGAAACPSAVDCVQACAESPTCTTATWVTTPGSDCVMCLHNNVNDGEVRSQTVSFSAPERQLRGES
jgi:hypothetical protein